MKKTKMLYWVFTLLFIFMMAGSAIPDVLMAPFAVKGIHEGLGYPLYLVRFLGIAKLLGVTALLIPGFPGIREWAYAGLAFDLIGATFSVIAIGAGAGNILFNCVPVILGVLSYIYYHRMTRIRQVLYAAS